MPTRARNHGKTDSEPRVFATEHPVIAVFHALARTVKRSDPTQRSRKHGFSTDASNISLVAEPKLLAALKRHSQPTNIYILDKADFKRNSEMEWHAHKRISPLGVVFVSGKDLADLMDRDVTLMLLEGS